MADKAIRSFCFVAMFALLVITALLAATFSDLINPRNLIISKFVTVLFEQPFFVPACLIVLPSLLCKRSMFLGYSAALGVLLFTVWAVDEYQKYQAGHADSGGGGAFGEALFFVLVLSYSIGAIVRVTLYTIIMLVKSRRPETKSEETA